MDQTLRPMSTSQVLDRTFSLYRNNFFLFLGIALITPALKLLAGLGQLAIFGRLLVPQAGNHNIDAHMMQQFMIRMLIGVVISLLIYVVGTALASSATIYAVSVVHLGKTTTIRESYAKIGPIAGRIVGVIIRVSFLAFWPLLAGYGLIALAALSVAILGKGDSAAVIAIIAGLLAFAGIVGGLVWMFIAFCRYALAVPACTLERLPVKASIIRSKFLSRGRKGGIFLIYILTAIIGIALNYAFEIPALVVGKVAWVSASAQANMAIGALIWVYVAMFLAGALAGPIATIAIALIYYDERVRKEAFDLQLMMEAIGIPKPAQPQAQAQAAGGPTPTIG